jgi:hypothetical protein
MADSYSTLMRLILMADGENDNTWGAKTNTNWTLIERSIAKRAPVVLAAADVTLTSANGADDEARSLALDCSGVLSANVAVIVPNLSHFYVVRNGTTGNFTLTVKTASGTGVVIPQGRVVMVWVDGVGNGTVYSTIEAAASTIVRNAWTAGNSDSFETVTDAATTIIDCALGNVFRWTIGGNRTAQLDNPVDGSWIELYLKQDGTGSRLVTWPGNVVWAGGGAPVLSTAANSVDKITMRYDLAITTWYAEIVSNISVGGGGPVISAISISGGNTDVDVFALAGSPAGAVTVAVDIAIGAVVGASSPATAALNFDGFAVGSTISIVNRGYILGRGGRGGRGATAGDINSADFYGDGTAGTDGGPAITLPSTACTISITNVDGFIWGGGGGGGGGGVTHNGDGSNVGVGGGGGGGGAGGGIPGDGGSIVSANGAPGVAGGVGRQGVGGTGGAGADTGGTGTAGTGGAGGDYGAVGTAGQTQTANTYDGAPGAGGAAGKAIDINGGSAPTFVSGSGSPNVKGAVS